MKIMSDEQKLKIAESVKKTKTKNRNKTLQRRLQKKINEKLKLEDFIVCPLCLKETNNEILSRIKLITKSHLLKHDYTFEQFKREFPNFQTATNSIKNNQSSKLSGQNHFNYGKKLSSETKQKIVSSVVNHNLSITKKCEKCGKPIISEYDLCKKCRKQKYLNEDTNDLVYCRICHIVKKDLSQHIKQEHKLTIKQYKSLFEAEVYSKEYRKRISKFRHDNVLSEEQKQKIRQSMIELHKTQIIEKIEWEDKFNIDDWKEYTETDTSQLIDTDDYTYCRICLKKMNQISPQHLYQHKLTSSMYMRLFPQSIIIPKNVTTKLTLKSLQTKKDRNIVIGQNWGYGGYRKDIGHYVRSMVEANFCRILLLNNVRYEYEPQIFKLKNQEFLVYIPDLKLIDSFKNWDVNTYIELKRNIHEEDEKKIKCFLAEYPFVNMIIVEQRSQIWRQMQSEYQKLLPLWEDKYQNIKVTPELYK
jgi:hypothetical protein